MMARLARVLAIGLLLPAAGPALAERPPVREIEITSEPEEDGKKVFSFRMLPGKSIDYDELEFKCILRQEFPWEDLRGRKTTKIHEPVVFVYRHAEARLVDDLHAYFNFRVPISLERLIKKYGEDVFNPDAPVTVARIRISGIKDAKVLWSHELEAKGTHTIKEGAGKPNEEDDVELEPELE